MRGINTNVGTHKIQFVVKSQTVRKFILGNFKIINEIVDRHDIVITIEEGYGTAFIDYDVKVLKNFEEISFERADYKIVSNMDFTKARIFVHNDLALKHALTNLYSCFLVRHNWGLLIHSSCAIEAGKAHLFAGQSGAGKSTAARLSLPRELLSDEATLVKITPNGVTVFNSPFRSEIKASDVKEHVPLESIQILHQASQNKKIEVKKSDALLHLMDKVFYWTYSPEETRKIIGLLKTLVERVPTYNLHFRKDNTFWELIS